MRRTVFVLLFCLAFTSHSSPITRFTLHPSPFTGEAWAAVPWLINYQGRLTDTSSNSVVGTQTMTFRLYDAATGGTKQWEEQHAVTLSKDDNGIFSVVLGSVTVLTAVDFNTPMWLSVQVADDAEMSPRQRLTATGYAMNADQLDSLDSAKFLRADIDTSTSGKLTITRSGVALLIKPTTNPEADTKLIDVQNASGTSKFSVDLEGDVSVAGDLAVSGTVSGSTATTGTTSTSWTTGSGTDAASSNISLLFGQTSGQESLVFQGASADDFILSDDLRLNAQSALRLLDSDSSNYVALRAPSTVSSDVTWTLPSADGTSGQVLSTNGSGTLSWAADANSGGTLTGVTAGTGLSGGGSSGSVTLSLSTPVSVAYGGTGAASLTANGVLYGAGTSAISATSAGTTGTVLHGNTSAAPSFSAVSLTADVSGTLPLANGGTNSASLTNCSSGQVLTVTSGAVACTSTITASSTSADSLDFSEFKDSMALDATTTIDLGGFDLVLDDLSSSDVFQLQNAQSTADTVTMYVNDTATANGAEFRISPSDGGVVIDTTGADELSSVTTTDAREALAIATDPDEATGDADGVIKLGKQDGAWEYIQYDASLGSNGKFLFSAPLQVSGSSPASIEFADGSGTTKTLTYDSTATNPFTFDDKVSVVDLKIAGSSPAGITFGEGANTQTFSFNPNAGGEFAFSGGVFAQQFRNLVENGSFEAFSALETFGASTAGGNAGGAGYFFEGGWDNFAPDGWLWEAGKVYQHSPVLFTPGTSIDETYLQKDYFHGKSAVTLEDFNTASANSYTDIVTSYGAIVDAHIEQTITNLNPSTSYSVGAYMLTRSSSGGAANTATEAIVDISGEDVVDAGAGDNGPATTVRTLLTTAPTMVETASATDISGFPESGVLLIDNERISYAGRDTTNKKFTFCIRAFDGTTAATHAVGAAVKIAPFKHLTTLNSATASKFTLYKGQFATDSKASDVKIHLICKGGASGDQCRFDGVQVVEGRSVPEFQPSSIIDTGDQTLYGTLRMGRTSDGRGGILAVDKSVRTRSIEFFEKDPGMSGTVGGFGGVQSTTKVVSGTNSTITLTTSGTYYGVSPREFRVTLNAGSPPATFEWAYRDCPPCTGTFTVPTGGSSLNISSFTSPTEPNVGGAAGVKLQFGTTGGGVASDRWTFTSSGMNMAAQYNSYSGTASYQPGNTRIYKDPYNGKLTFQDGSAIITLDQITGAGVATTAHVDSPLFFPASSGGGQMSLEARDGYLFTGASNTVTFEVEICSGQGGSGRDTFQWRDNIQNGGQGTPSGWDISCTEIPAGGGPYTLSIPGGGGSTYGFKIFFNSSYGAWQEGNTGDRWQIYAYPGASSSAIKTLTATANQGISVTGTGDSRSLALIDCAANEVLKRNVGDTAWACAPDATGGGSSALSGLTDAAGAKTLANTDYAQVWNWQVTTADKIAFTFGETTASTATGAPILVKAKTLATSTAIPLYVENAGAAASFRVDDAASDTTPFLIDASGSVGIGTTGPGKILDINSATGANLRLTYNDADGSAVNYADLSMSSAGDLTVAPSGGDVAFTDGTNTLASVIDLGTYGTVRLTSKGSTGDPSTCTAGDLYFNADDATIKACTAANSWEALDSASGATALSGIGVAAGTNTIANTDYAQVWNWQVTTADKIAFTFGETTASTATGAPILVKAKTLATSTAIPLYVENAGAAASFRVDDAASDTTPFLIDASGSVGIGTTSPASQLYIKASTNSYAGGIVIEDNDDGKGGLITKEGAKLWFGHAPSASAPTTGAVTLMVLEDDGDVGIGTSLPAGPFELVHSGGGTLNGMIVTNQTAGANQAARLAMRGESASLTFGATSAAYGSSFNDLGFILADSGASGGLLLGTQANAPVIFQTTASNTEQMRITGTGNVGIGETNPTSRLHLAGNLTAASWGTAGIGLQQAAATYTDSSAASTRATGAAVSFAQPTFAASNASTVITDAATLYIANAPLAGTNMALTNPYALWVDAGKGRFDGNVDIAGTTTLTGPLSYGTGGQPKRTIVLTAAGAIVAGGGAPQTLSGTNFKYYTVDYSDGSTKDAYWQFVVPDSYTGTTLEATISWLSSANCTAPNCEVVWQVASDSRGNADTFDAALANSANNTATANATAGILNATSAISLTTGWADSKVAVVRVSRIGGDAADDLSATANLVMVKLEWTASEESD